MSHWWVRGHVWTLDDDDHEVIVDQITGGGDSELVEVVEWCRQVAAADPRRCYWEAWSPSSSTAGQEAPL